MATLDYLFTRGKMHTGIRKNPLLQFNALVDVAKSPRQIRVGEYVPFEPPVQSICVCLGLSTKLMLQIGTFLLYVEKVK